MDKAEGEVYIAKLKTVSTPSSNAKIEKVHPSKASCLALRDLQRKQPREVVQSPGSQ